MTTPIATGYPDWGRRVANSDAVYSQVATQVINAAYTIPITYVGDISHIGQIFTAAVGNFQVDFTFYADAAQVIPLGQHSFQVRQGGQAQHSVPVRGPFVVMTIQATAYPATFDFFAWSVTNKAHDTFNGPIDAQLIANTGAAVGIGATLVTDCVNCRPGPGHLSVTLLNAGQALARLYSYDWLGNLRIIATHDTAKQNSPSPIWLPATALRLQVQNLSGAATSVYACVTTPPADW